MFLPIIYNYFINDSFQFFFNFTNPIKNGLVSIAD